MNKQFLLVSYCLLLWMVLVAQDPGKQLLWERIFFLRDSAASMAPDQKLEALLKLESKFKNDGYRNDSTCTLLLQRIGAAYYTLGDFNRALKYTVQSINLIHTNSAQTFTDKNCLLKNYSNLAIYFDSLNNYKGRKMALDSCIAIARNWSSGIVPEVYLIALVNKVKDLFYAGDYFRCFDYATSGELASRKYDGYNAKNYQIYFLTWIGNVIIASKDPDLYEQGEAVLLSALTINKNAGSKISELGTIYELLAEIMMGKGNWDRALKYFRQALLNEQQNGTKVGCAQILNNIGELYYSEHLKDYKKALITYKQALQVIDDNNATGQLNSSEFAPILSNIAGIYVRRGMYDSMMYYFQLALKKIGIADVTKLPDNPENPFFNKINIKYLIEIIVGKGDSFLAFYKNKKDPGYLIKAVKEYKLADRLLDKFKPNLNELESKLFWRKKSRSLYEHAIEACYYQNKAEDAFYFFEKSRAVILSDQLNEQTWLGQDDI
ncbi:MAG: tetratricopeptide repeat protein, partial [Ginsengibacter sp.]